jgi:hypothetical protein
MAEWLSWLNQVLGCMRAAPLSLLPLLSMVLFGQRYWVS